MAIDNLLSKTARLHVEERFSDKTKKPYNVLVVTFQSGYIFETFLNNEQRMLIEYASQHQNELPGASASSI